MGISIVLKEAKFTKNIGSILYENRQELIGEWFGGSRDFALINKAGEGNLQEMGTPEYGSNYIRTVGSSAYLTANLPELDNSKGFTIIHVSRGAERATRGVSGMHFKKPSITGSFTLDGLGLVTYQAGEQSLAAVSKPLPNNKWIMSAHTAKSGGHSSIYLWLDGILFSNTSTNVGTPWTGVDNNIYIAAEDKGTEDWAYIAVFNRVLTSIEIEQAYESVKKILDMNDVTVE